MIEICPVTLTEAHAYVNQHHRHHGAAVGALFAIACTDGEEICGVCVVGRPVSRRNQDGYTAEVTRLCTNGAKNACSMLYAAAWRAARAMGYRRLITFILDSEPGTSLQAAGWKCIGKTRGGSWNVPSRPRVDKSPTQPKLKFEIS
ncbi:MAG: XF1762 family protein [Acidobacteriota bacterium]